MTKIIIAIILFISSLVSAQNVNLTVSISGLKNDSGILQVGLFNSEGAFLKSIYKGFPQKLNRKKLLSLF